MIPKEDEEIELNQLSILHPSAIDNNEMAPSSMFYNSFGQSRPHISDLRKGIIEAENPDQPTPPKRPPPRFSTINGVYLRCIYNIISAVYYLRLGTVVAQCGLWLALVMILVSALITTLTALCLSSLVTNGKVKGGGIYYFVSRSIGADWGGTVGIVFAFATTFNSVLQVFGFVEVVRDLIGFDITKNGKWDIPIIGISLATVQVISISVSLTFDFYFQNVMAVLIAVSLVAIFLGPANPKTPKWLISNIKNNLSSDFREGSTFFSVFAAFFPACCGIMAGSNISGDLVDPQKSIPIGTIGAIWTTTIIYLVTAVILASAGDREVLHYDFNLLGSVTVWKPLFIAGVLGASISSSATALVDGPKILQAVCRDEIMPKFMNFFAVGKKSTDDPVRGFFLAYVIVVISTFIFKDLEAVGTALTNFFLISFVLVDLSCIIGPVSQSPTWRPTWKYNNVVISILATIICIAAMFLMNWIFALCVIFISVVLFATFHWSQASNHNWGSFTQALLYTDIVQKIDKLTNAPTHIKNFRPQIEYMILPHYDLESQIRNLLPFKEIVDASHSVVTVSICDENILHQETNNDNNSIPSNSTEQQTPKTPNAGNENTGSENAEGENDPKNSEKKKEVSKEIQTKNAENIVSFHKANSTSNNNKDNKNKDKDKNKASDHQNVILPNSEANDQNSEGHNILSTIPTKYIRKWKDMSLSQIASNIINCGIGRIKPNLISFSWNKAMFDSTDIFHMAGAAFDSNMSVCISRGFDQVDPNLEQRWPIDVWWLLDDGGMTLLIAYLLHEHELWEKCHLRVFAIARQDEILNQRQLKLQSMINKFRIPSEVVVITGIENSPKEETRESWISNYAVNINEEVSNESEKRKINGMLRLREMILDHSSNSSIVICSMQLPVLSMNPKVWLSMIDFVSDAMPPFIWAHGNNENVLTFNI